MKQSITDLVVRKIAPPTKGQLTIWDKTLPNFGLRISQGGTRSWVVQHGPTRQLITIGRYPIISVADARGEAKRILAERTLGKSRPTRITFDEARDQFLTHCEEKNRPRTVSDYRRLLRRHFKFGGTQLAEITPQEITRRLAKLKDVPSERHHAFVVAKIFFTWAARRHYVDTNPCDRIDAPRKGASRSRVLTDAELAEVFSKATTDPFPYGPILILLLATGQRRGEIGNLKWDWIDQDERLINLPAAITKNRRPHTFPYGRIVHDLLDAIPNQGEYLFPATRDHVRGKPTTVFNGWPKANAQFDARLTDVEPFTHHDLRRTFSTKLAELGVAPHVIERLLNHSFGAIANQTVGGAVSAVAAVYNRYQYIPEMRAAVEAWEVHLSDLLRRFALEE